MELEVSGITAWHETPAGRSVVVENVSFTLGSGALGAVLGPSGSGKTTLLRVIAGLHRGASGTIRLDGRRLDDLPPERRGVGLVPQDGALFPHLTVAENIDFGLPRRRRRGPRTTEMLDLLGLQPFALRLPHQLSGGQAQRVAVARALAPEPRLVLLDEPFSALDAALRSEVREGVRRALEATGTAALLVTHDQGEALSMSTDLIVLAEGRIRQIGTPDQVYAEPVDLWTGQFVGEANTLAGISDGHIVTTSLGAFPHRSELVGPVIVLVRPEGIGLGGSHGAGATVRSTRYFGHDGIVELELDTGGTVLARLHAAAMPPIGHRTTVGLAGRAKAFPEGLIEPRSGAQPAAPESSSNPAIPRRRPARPATDARWSSRG
ncbi:MAG: ABC transporter ATP-binding protein [Propionicimonas sp.]